MVAGEDKRNVSYCYRYSTDTCNVRKRIWCLCIGYWSCMILVYRWLFTHENLCPQSLLGNLKTCMHVYLVIFKNDDEDLNLNHFTFLESKHFTFLTFSNDLNLKCRDVHLCIFNFLKILLTSWGDDQNWYVCLYLVGAG